jgi:hypothetical protein
MGNTTIDGLADPMAQSFALAAKELEKAALQVTYLQRDVTPFPISLGIDGLCEPKYKASKTLNFPNNYLGIIREFLTLNEEIGATSFLVHPAPQLPNSLPSHTVYYREDS